MESSIISFVTALFLNVHCKNRSATCYGISEAEFSFYVSLVNRSSGSPIVLVRDNELNNHQTRLSFTDSLDGTSFSPIIAQWVPMDRRSTNGGQGTVLT